jgi:iron complex transport system substrate-binding protein
VVLKFHTSILIITILAQVGCNSFPNRQEASDLDTLSAVVEKPGFEICQYDSFKTVTVFDPWQGARGIKMKYILARKGVTVPDSLKELEKIELPVKRMICFSTTHVAMLTKLQAEENLVATSGVHFISDPDLVKRVESGLIEEIGHDHGISFEKIISLKPDVVMTYGVSGEINKEMARLKDLGIHVVYNGDYLESSPLRKFEWILFVSAFFDKEAMADSIVRQVNKEYKALVRIADEVNIRPTVMTGLPWKDTWWVPGGRTFAASFIHDAGGSYLWKDDSTYESIPLDIESVYSAAYHADVWINPGVALIQSDILQVDQRLNELGPVTKNQIYNNNRRMNRAGGNDYWESGAASPHLILKDLIKIFHPELLPDHQLYYYQKIERVAENRNISEK